ncbi:hypothetical protein FB382_002922 [Nocardioides ginsengisegetis]|uniref:Glycosyl transferase family 8 n=1 Tax=Nocardioides ginsengisegetis TaxID=661491 RepID=A0A7W3J1P6_9ACTN|nr:nucleotide-diphospho-sugar transferase [Nocardioides ginsengisegetis]MBA8804631.1 hypothetical protein [Nocardioides ginsengisegetis]
MIAVMYEDRADSLVGLKLTVLSVRHHSPDLPVLVWVPDAPEAFLAWSRTVPLLEVRTDRTGITGSGWGVKPAVLLAALDGGAERATWIDSDVVLNGDLGELLAGAGPDELVATEEYHWGHQQGTSLRTSGLGLPVGRVFAATVNTGLVSVTPAHRTLLEAWAAQMASEAYAAAQLLPAHERPLHFWGDQDTLTGLLGSQGFRDVRVRQLRRGVDIAQCYGPSGLTVRERVRLGGSLPVLVHAMGSKPWSIPDRTSGGALGRARLWWERVHAEAGPYLEVARAHEQALGEPAPWLHPRTRSARVLTALTRSRPALRELPLAVADSTQRGLRRRLRIGQLGTRATGAAGGDPVSR